MTSPVSPAAKTWYSDGRSSRTFALRRSSLSPPSSVSMATATIVSLFPTPHGSTSFRIRNTKTRSPFVFSIENERMSA